MIASLMMYDRSELAAPLARYWAAIRNALAARDIDAPETLSNEAEEFSVWKAPDLVLSQTCGMPYRLWLHDLVTLVGTPDFGVTGCPPGHYRSAIVVRATDPRERLADFAGARFAHNQTFSQSGYAAIYAVAREQGFWFDDRVQSHGHVHSARAVADNRADIAALDAVSWRLMRRFDGFAADLRVLEWTPPTPALPYITARHEDGPAIFDAVAEAIAALSAGDRADLGLRGIVAIPKAAYLEIPNPPEHRI